MKLKLITEIFLNPLPKKNKNLHICVFYHESFHGSVERIQKDAGNRACLGCPVPAIRAVHQHTDAFISHCLRHREDRVILELLRLLQFFFIIRKLLLFLYSHNHD